MVQRSDRFVRTVAVFAGLLCALPVSCSVKEDRTECPCYLDVVVKAEAVKGKDAPVWCSVYAHDGALLVADSARVAGNRDTVFSYAIRPRREVSVIVSNRAPVNGAVCAAYGGQYDSVWAVRKDAACSEDGETVTVDRLDKQFCVLAVGLGDNMMEYASSLSLEVTGEYDGLSLPAMGGHPGKFRCRTSFEGNRKVEILLPRQGGPGLWINLLVNGTERKNSLDLYSAMVEAGYDWTSAGLEDFKIELSLDKPSLTGDVQDWKISVTHVNM